MQRILKALVTGLGFTLAFACQAQVKKTDCSNNTSLTPSQKTMCQTFKAEQARLQARKLKVEQELIALEEKRLNKANL